MGEGSKWQGRSGTSPDPTISVRLGDHIVILSECAEALNEVKGRNLTRMESKLAIITEDVLKLSLVICFHASRCSIKFCQKEAIKCIG